MSVCYAARRPAVTDVTLPPRLAGTMTSLVGPNVAFKSALLRGIAGLSRANGGCSSTSRPVQNDHRILELARQGEIVQHHHRDGLSLTQVGCTSDATLEIEIDCLLPERLKDGGFRWPKLREGLLRVSAAQIALLLRMGVPPLAIAMEDVLSKLC